MHENNSNTTRRAHLLTIGWREWLSLPELGVAAIKAKTDTGARTSAIHAENIERYQHKGIDRVRFELLPLQRSDVVRLQADAPLIDIREVTDSGGKREERFVVLTLLRVGEFEREIELTLTARPTMLFRMLLGRTAMVPGLVVNPAMSFTTGRPDLSIIYPETIRES